MSNSVDQELDLSKPLKWMQGDEHQVGRAAMVLQRFSPNNPHRPHIDEPFMVTPFYDDDRLLVRHAHTGELELVPLEELSNYVIPEEYKSP